MEKHINLSKQPGVKDTLKSVGDKFIQECKFAKEKALKEKKKTQKLRPSFVALQNTEEKLLLLKQSFLEEKKEWEKLQKSKCPDEEYKDITNPDSLLSQEEKRFLNAKQKLTDPAKILDQLVDKVNAVEPAARQFKLFNETTEKFAEQAVAKLHDEDFKGYVDKDPKKLISGITSKK